MANVIIDKKRFLPFEPGTNIEIPSSIIDEESIENSNQYPYQFDGDKSTPPKARSIDDGQYSKEEISDINEGGTFHTPEGDVDASSFANLTKTGDLRYFQPLLNANGLRRIEDIDYFSQRYRFGIMDPYHQLQHAREYLFFTKPDLNIFPRDKNSGVPDTKIAEYLQTQPEWMEFANNHMDVLRCLQSSLKDPDGVHNPFNNLLGNMVSNNLEIPGLSSDTIETANSTYGVNVQYHGSSEASNDNFDFTLEFRDIKSLPVYTFFKAYEDYHTLAHHGVLDPWINYVWYHVLYDQYSIYKFVVDEDAETIVYYGKFYGVFSKSLPRDIFTNTDFSDGINYTVDFHAFSYRDMNPLILKEFNALGRELWNSARGSYELDVWNEVLDRVDNRPGKAAKVFWEWHPIYNKPMPKLRWRGDVRY